MYGGKGIGFDEEGGTNAVENSKWSSGFEGSEGGYSKIRFTMKKDEEYVLTGLFCWSKCTIPCIEKEH